MLIPTMCYLWKISGSTFQRIVISIISIGIALTQWQAIATYHLTSNIVSESSLSWSIDNHDRYRSFQNSHSASDDEQHRQSVENML